VWIGPIYAAYGRVAHTRNRRARFPATFLLCRAAPPVCGSTTPARPSGLSRHPAPFAWCSPAVTVPCAALTSPAQWGAPPDVRRLDDRWLDVNGLDVRRAADRTGCRRRIANRMIRRRGPCRSCRAVPSDSGLRLGRGEIRLRPSTKVAAPTCHLRPATSDPTPPTGLAVRCSAISSHSERNADFGSQRRNRPEIVASATRAVRNDSERNRPRSTRTQIRVTTGMTPTKKRP